MEIKTCLEVVKSEGFSTLYIDEVIMFCSGNPIADVTIFLYLSAKYFLPMLPTIF